MLSKATIMPPERRNSCQLWTYVLPFFSVSIIDSEQMNVCWLFWNIFLISVRFLNFNIPACFWNIWTNIKSAKADELFLVCLTILWGWRLKVNVLTERLRFKNIYSSSHFSRLFIWLIHNNFRKTTLQTPWYAQVRLHIRG